MVGKGSAGKQSNSRSDDLIGRIGCKTLRLADNIEDHPHHNYKDGNPRRSKQIKRGNELGNPAIRSGGNQNDENDEDEKAGSIDDLHGLLESVHSLNFPSLSFTIPGI